MTKLPASALLFLLVTALGCGDPATPSGADLGASVAATPDAAACALVKPYAATDATCDACAQAHCCVEVNTCYGAASCDDLYVNCYLGCGLFADADAGTADATACVADCGVKYPVGKLQFEAAIGCVDTHCTTVCK